MESPELLSTNAHNAFFTSVSNILDHVFIDEHLVSQGSYRDPIITQALDVAIAQWTSFSQDSNAITKMDLAFGENWLSNATSTNFDDLALGIVVLDSNELGANGAFGDDTIFLSTDLLDNNLQRPEIVAQTIIEEFGHYLDSHLNPEDSPGDEGAIFNYLVQDVFLDKQEILALKSEADSGTILYNGQPVAVEFMEEETGAFTVGDGGEVTIDFLLDSGIYNNQLGIFSLEGMDNLPRDSADFRQEAARRASSNSSLGYVIVSDLSEGAKFTGDVGEDTYNAGNYRGSLTFDLNPGEQFAFILVPDGAIEDLITNPTPAGEQLPLFSLAAANPDGASHIAQLANVANGIGFAMEDMRLDDPNSDRDYNDLIIHMQGATGQTIALDEVTDANLSWRTTNTAQQVIEFLSQPASITVALLNDTGIDNTDSITFDPTITGIINDVSRISNFQANLDNQSNVEILLDLQSDGSFSLDAPRLAEINASALADGNHTIQLITTDVDSVTQITSFSFTLDTQIPEIIITEPANGETVSTQAQLTGSADGTGSQLQSLTYRFNQNQDIVIPVNDNGTFDQQLNLTGLENSFPTLTISASDLAGNLSNNEINLAAPFTTESQLQYIDFAPGDGVTPNNGQRVTVHYTGTFTNGEVFDSSLQRGVPFTFTLGVGEVIRGWDEGIATMSVGSRRRLIIPPDLAYGETGRGSIPPNATLIFDVELLSISNV